MPQLHVLEAFGYDFPQVLNSNSLKKQSERVTKGGLRLRLKELLLLPTLLLAIFLTASSIVFFSTLLFDIATDFQVQIGTASQISQVTSFAGLFLGFAMGALTLRFKHKSLFLLGIALFAAGALGFFVAPSFAAAIFVNLFIGLGSGIVGIMVYSFIGELFPLEKRGWVVGLTFSASFLAWVVVGPVAGKIAELAGWRLVLLMLIFPISMVCLLFAWLAIPFEKRSDPSPVRSKYLDAFKQILTSKSAVACLFSTTLLWISTCAPIYAVSFYRVFFSVPPSEGGTFAAVAAAGGIFGGAVGGRLINRCGRKLLTVGGILASGVFAVMIAQAPSMWISVASWAVSATTGALAMAAFSSLILEQVPAFRASMMSVNGTFQSLGSILGVAIGGLVLDLYANNFQLLLTIFGGVSIVLAFVVFLFTKDPCRIAQSA